MAITADSRYATATVITVEGPGGETRQEMRVAFPRSRRVSYTYRRVLDGDRVDIIAKEAFGRGELWWMIADANPEILDWMRLTPGSVIRVPNA